MFESNPPPRSRSDLSVEARPSGVAACGGDWIRWIACRSVVLGPFRVYRGSAIDFRLGSMNLRPQGKF